MEDTNALLRNAQSGDRFAAEKLVEENTGLIWSIVRRYFGRGIEPEDLFQLGCLGFIKAIHGFDESYGTQFSTYAVPKIAGEIRRFLRDDGAIKVSRCLKERASLIHNSRVRLEQMLGRDPSVGEISAETGLSPEDIAEAESAVLPAESLQRENGDEGLTLEHVLGDGGHEEQILERMDLRSAINQLSDKERQVVFLRFYHALTQSDCAKIMKISQVQISRLERKAMEDLRAIIN